MSVKGTSALGCSTLKCIRTSNPNGFASFQASLAASLSALRRGQGGVTTSGTATLLDGLLFPLCQAAELIVDVSMLVVLLSPIGRWVTTNTTEGNTLGSSRTAG